MQGTSLWVASEDGDGSVGVTTRTPSLNTGSSVWIYYVQGRSALKG